MLTVASGARIMSIQRRRTKRYPNTPRPNNKEDHELFLKYQGTKVHNENGKLISSDLKLRNQLADRNARLVTFMVNKFYSRKKKHLELRDDLLQEGHIGLVHAVEGFKPEMGIMFSTYAGIWIRQAIKTYLLEHDPFMPIPGHVRTANNKLVKHCKEVGKPTDNFFILTDEELATLEITKNMVDCVEAARKTAKTKTVFVDFFQDLRPNSEVSETSFLKGLPAEQDDRFINKRLLLAAKKAFTQLTLRERCVLLERYGIDSRPYWNGETVLSEEDNEATK